MILMTIVLIGLIYNFLNTIFKSDIKRFSHDRIYVDYSSYKTANKSTTGYTKTARYSPIVSRQVYVGKKRLTGQLMQNTIQAYGQAMAHRLSQIKVPESKRPKPDPLFLETKKLAAEAVPDLIRAQSYFAKRDLKRAVRKFLEILSTLNRKDLHHRCVALNGLAECYFTAKNDRGYVQYKVQFVEVKRQLKDIIRRAFPDAKDDQFGDWISSEEASQNLLRVRTFASKIRDPRQRESMVRRARLDLDVARQLHR